MKKLLRVLKWAFVVLAVILVGIQFVRPARTNPPVEQTSSLEAHTQMTPEVASILDRSCRDCHSNRTVWPWYSNVAPVSWWLIDHVNHGRSHFNYSEWSKLKPEDQSKRLQEICDEVLEGAMPLPSYLPMHPAAKLAEQDKRTLCEWTEKERKRISP